MSAAVSSKAPRADLATLVGTALLIGLTLLAYRALLGDAPQASLGTPEGAEDFLFEPAGGSPPLLVAVALWMTWRRRSRLAARFGAPPSGLSPVLLALGGIVAVWAHFVAATDLLVVSLGLVLLGAGGLLGGGGGIRILLLPALFLLFAVPIPPPLLNRIIFPLQGVMAALSTELLGWIGIAARLEGQLIFTEDEVFNVIETCSGLRLMETLAFSAVVYADLLRRPRLHMLLLTGVAPAVGAAVNVLRIVAIVLNPYSEFSLVHSIQGVVMLVAGVLALAAIDHGIQLSGLAPAHAGRGGGPEPPAANGRRPAPLRIAGLASVLVALGVLPHGIPPWRPEGSAVSLYRLPATLSGWTSQGLRVDEEFLGSVGFRERVHRRYRRGPESVDLFVGLDRRLERGYSAISAKTALPGSRWEVEARSARSLSGVGPTAEELVIRSARGRRLSLHWYEGVGALGVESLRSLLALDRGPLRRPGHALVVRLGTPLGLGGDARERAAARLGEFASLLRAALREIGVSGVRQASAGRTDHSG